MDIDTLARKSAYTISSEAEMRFKNPEGPKEPLVENLMQMKAGETLQVEGVHLDEIVLAFFERAKAEYLSTIANEDTRIASWPVSFKSNHWALERDIIRNVKQLLIDHFGIFKTGLLPEDIDNFEISVRESKFDSGGFNYEFDFVLTMRTAAKYAAFGELDDYSFTYRVHIRPDRNVLNRVKGEWGVKSNYESDFFPTNVRFEVLYTDVASKIEHQRRESGDRLLSVAFDAGFDGGGFVDGAPLIDLDLDVLECLGFTRDELRELLVYDEMHRRDEDAKAVANGLFAEQEN